MASETDIHHRRSIRLKAYDYSQTGLYFLTICTYERQALFGTIKDGELLLNDCGRVAHNEWLKTAQIRENIVLHDFVVMPNHLHGIVEIQAGRMPCAPTIGDLVRGYKSSVTRCIREVQKDTQLLIWQRNYYEHIIRSEASYLTISEYIQTNPQRWAEDTYFVADNQRYLESE